MVPKSLSNFNKNRKNISLQWPKDINSCCIYMMENNFSYIIFFHK